MPTSSSYLCGCGRFMRCKQNSVTVEELLEDGGPYKLWSADLMECVECGVEIISGFGRAPLAEHWQPEYATIRARRVPIYPGRCREDAPSENPRVKNDDDGIEYGHPRDRMEGRE